ncbi:NAD(P)-dependent oxidoreductase [Actinoplanes italicus]|uniref:NAD(P)H dehydrogenase (Quinone) n=1 Tax=Actinoplanes italicus TaxID=113567 RepID=A0A2T0KGE1_9ACTN|nr:NAD(P)H dehydrogenase (quinone) [Actinoplanes italicus]GIE36917.1 NAD(P)-dependent oxidoreductase [Actinoplanes italicus]
MGGVSKRIAVTGGAGALGSAVVRQLRGRADVIVVTRRPEAVPPGVEVRPADFDDIGPEAFAGAGAVLVVSTDQRDNERRAAQHAAAIAAAAEAGAGHLVYTSLAGCDGPPDMLNAAHRASEAALRASGVPWTSLRNNLYLEGLDGLLAAAAATGRYVSNAGGGGVAYVSRDRCARVAAEALLQPARGVVEVHGPRVLNAAAVAALLSERLGRTIEPVLLDDREYGEHLLSTGAPPALVAALVALGQAIRDGVYAGAPA